jgi:hypothetical protein
MFEEDVKIITERKAVVLLKNLLEKVKIIPAVSELKRTLENRMENSLMPNKLLQIHKK